MNWLRSVPFVIMASLFVTDVATACSCQGNPSPLSDSVRASSVIFVGNVSRLDRAQPIARNAVPTLDVNRVFRGHLGNQVVMASAGGNCDEPFEIGQVWLVYASESDLGLVTDKCMRTRPRFEAAPDIEYLEGVEQKRPQGIVYGLALRRRIDADGQPALAGLLESLHVVAAGPGGRFVTMTDHTGYQLVLPPGDFDVWAERSAQRVSPPQRVHVSTDTSKNLMVIASFELAREEPRESR